MDFSARFLIFLFNIVCMSLDTGKSETPFCEYFNKLSQMNKFWCHNQKLFLKLFEKAQIDVYKAIVPQRQNK